MLGKRADSGLSVPQVIHFIWAGGDGLMKQPGIRTVAHWCSLNPQFTVYLWVDEEYSGGLNNIKKAYSEIYDKYEINVVLESEEEERETARQLIVKDIGCFRDELYRSEVEQLLPNYGCSSDLLRLRILYRYGGCYFDQDVEPNPQCTLEQSDLFHKRDRHMLLLDHQTQRSTPKLAKPVTKSMALLKEYYNFFKVNLNRVGNDSIITTPQNPLIGVMLEFIEGNYQLQTESDLDRERILQECFGCHDRMSRTVARTGPHAVRTCLSRFATLNKEKNLFTINEELGKSHKFVDQSAQAVDFEPMRIVGRELIRPRKNDRNWLNVKPAARIGFDAGCDRIFKRMQFEIEHFRVLLLGFHLDTLIEMASFDTAEEQQRFVTDFISKVAELDLTSVAVVYPSLFYPETVDFCNEHQLDTLFDLCPEEALQATQYMLQLHELHTSIREVKSALKRSTGSCENSRVNEYFEKHPHCREKISNQLNSTLLYLRELQREHNFMRFSKESQEKISSYIEEQKDTFAFARFLLGASAI